MALTLLAVHCYNTSSLCPQERVMIVIGATGGIGTGKSEVSRYLSELGASVIDADQIGHTIYLPDTQGWREIVDTFGEDILLPNREVDRRKLGPIVFGDPKALEKLNAITHPKIRQRLIELIQEKRDQEIDALVLEAAILIEVNWVDLVDEVWVTVADPEKVVERVKQRSNIPEEQILSRIKAQMPQEERIRHATVVVENNAGLDELRTKLQTLWDTRVKGKG